MTYQGRLGPLVDLQYVSANAYTTGSAATPIPSDDTIPQITEGNALPALDLTIRPKSRASVLRYSLLCQSATTASAAWAQMAIFKDGAADAIASGALYVPSANQRGCLPIYGEVVPGGVAPVDFEIRYSSSIASNTMRLHGNTSRLYGGTVETTFQVEEYLPADFRSRSSGWPGRVKQVGTQFDTSNTWVSFSNTPVDDTIPQITEGTEVVAGTLYTPRKAGNLLRIRAGGTITANVAKNLALHLHRNSDADAIAATSVVNNGNQYRHMVNLRHYYTAVADDVANGVSFSTRAGKAPSNDAWVNGIQAGRRFGGVMTHWLVIDEFEFRT